MNLKSYIRRFLALLLSLLFLFALLPAAAGAAETTYDVLFHVTVNGYPWKWGIIQIYNSAGELVDETFSDDLGNAVAALPTGVYTYKTTYGGSTEITSVSDGQVTVRNGDVPSVPVELTTTASVTHEVQISVVDADNNPLDGATVNILDYGFGCNVITSAQTVNGVATLRVGAGTYDVSVTKLGYACCSAGGRLKVFEDGTFDGDRLNVELQPTAGTYDATFKVYVDGDSWSGARVMVHKDGELVGYQETDASGEAVIPNLPDGEYTFDVACSGYAALLNSKFTIIGGNKEIIATVPRMNSNRLWSITIPVRDVDGNALDDVQVTLIRQNTNTFWASETSAAGTVTFDVCQDGSWTLTASKPGYKDATATVFTHGENTPGVLSWNLFGGYNGGIRLIENDANDRITGTVNTDAGTGTVTLALYKGTIDSPGEKVTEQTVTLSGTAAAFNMELPAALDGEYFLIASCEGFTSCYVCGITGSVDISEALELYGGDLSGDGSINDADYLLFMNAYAISGTGGGLADINHDGVVNDGDYLLFLANYANDDHSRAKVITL